MNILVKELRSNYKVLIAWVLIVAFFVAAGTVKFTGVEAGGANMMQQLLDSFPRVVLAVMGMVDVNLGTFSGFYGMLEFYIAIMVAVYAVHLGRNAVSRESIDGTYEFLFIRPRTRSFVLAMKLIAALACLVVVCGVNFVTSWAAYQVLDLSEDMTGTMAAFSLWLGVIGLAFMALGAAASAACRRPETGARVGNALVLAAYLFGVVYDLLGNDALVARVFSPFKYFPPTDVLSGVVDPAFAVLIAGLTLLGFVAMFVCFNRQDLGATA